MKRFLLVAYCMIVAGCLPEPARECLGSNECTNGRVCRAGMCVQLGVVSRDTSDGGAPEDSHAPPRDVAPTDAERDAPPTDTHDTSDVTPDAEDVSEPPCPGASQPAPGDIRINEVLANPPADELGDANRDGVRDAFEDEFVEVVNLTDETLDLTQTRLFVGGSAKVLFSDICLPPGEGVVVFGGFRGEGHPIAARGSFAIVSSSRLGLSNSGGSISVARGDGTSLDAVSYADAPQESLTRAPQLTGTDFFEHSALPGDRLMSPGQCADGSILTTGCPNSEPETDADAGG